MTKMVRSRPRNRRQARTLDPRQLCKWTFKTVIQHSLYITLDVANIDLCSQNCVKIFLSLIVWKIFCHTYLYLYEYLTLENNKMYILKAILVFFFHIFAVLDITLFNKCTQIHLMEISFFHVRLLRAISIILAQDRVFYVLASKYNKVL